MWWSSPAGHGATLRDGVTPHVESHADDGAGQEDGEHHQRADQQVEEGVENGATEEMEKSAPVIVTLQACNFIWIGLFAS